MLVEQLPVNPEKQVEMAAYMKNRFPFLGLQAPVRKGLTKDLIRDSKQLPTELVLKKIAQYYALPEREYQYVAIDIATANVKRWSLTEIVKLADYVSEKAWWDSVDAWRKLFGLRIKYFPTEREFIFNHFYESQDFWQRRVAINLQLMEKERTELPLLTKAILKDQETDEFFIQKAIGWSLRQYSKTDQAWVMNFLETYQLSPLAVREASKHFSKKGN